MPQKWKNSDIFTWISYFLILRFKQAKCNHLRLSCSVKKIELYFQILAHYMYIVKKKQYSSNFQSVDVGQETRVTSETLNVTIGNRCCICCGFLVRCTNYFWVKDICKQWKEIYINFLFLKLYCPNLSG